MQSSNQTNMSSQTVIQPPKSNSRWPPYLPSISSILIFIYFVISLLMNGGFTPYKRGFFCNDTTIQYPFKTDTVSFKVLLVIALIIPWISIKLLERKRNQLLNKNNSARARSRSMQYDNDKFPRLKTEEELLMTTTEKVKRRTVVDETEMEICDISLTQCDNGGGDIGFKRIARRSITRKSMSDIQIFLFGFVTTSFMTGIGKMTCGRYRPHFMQRCMPDVDCTLNSNINRYITDYNCTNELLGPRGYSYITTSWPSGHAAMIFYSMLYMIYYLDTVIPAIAQFKSPKSVYGRISPLSMYSVYVLMVGLATYVSLTRVSDYHHHPLDVLSGIMIGVASAYIFATHVFKPAFSNQGYQERRI